jgi:16S rRNA (cytidine1402-2'-O)-methyltransferase
VFYESPQRILAALQDCIDVIGGNRKAALLREITKHYEQHICADLQTIKQQLEGQQEKIRGEFVLILEGNHVQLDTKNVEKATKLLEDLKQYMPLKEAVAIVVKYSGIRRNQLYSIGLENNLKKNKPL